MVLGISKVTVLLETEVVLVVLGIKVVLGIVVVLGISELIQEHGVLDTNSLYS